MEPVTRRTVLALAMPAALLALAGCGTATSAPGGDMNAADLEFVTQAYNIITFDREECSLAPTYAQTPAVKEIAAELLNRANAFAAKLDPYHQGAGHQPAHRTAHRPAGPPVPHSPQPRARFRSFVHRRPDRLAPGSAGPAGNAHGHAGTEPAAPRAGEGGYQEELRQSLAALRVIQRQLPTPPTTIGPFGLPPLFPISSNTWCAPRNRATAGR